MKTFSKSARRFILFTVFLLGVLQVICYVLYKRDSGIILRLTETRITPTAPASVKMEQAVSFMRENVPKGMSHNYFLLPVFRMLKPTALQIIHEGGDCAYRSRALIVILSHYGVKAEKVAVYNHQGKPVHAVVKVFTELGSFMVDMLFNMIHQTKEGKPIPIETLAESSVLENSVARNNPGGFYPIDEYPLDNLKTINWHKNSLLLCGYDILSLIVGQEHIDNLPRTIVAEEPAFMVMILCAGIQLLLLVFYVIIRKTEHHRASAYF